MKPKTKTTPLQDGERHVTQDNQAGPKAGGREWIGFAALLLPLLMVSMDVSVLYFAVPYIAKDLAPTNVQQLWIFDIYGFVLAGLLITMGTLGDRIGRRRLLMIGAVVFGAASVLAAYSRNPETLIAARALLGIGGATLMPSTLALIRNMFHDEKQRNLAVAIWTAALSSGVALGPVISGLLLENFWWGSVFLINIPAIALLLLLAPVLVPESRNPAPVRFDLLSAVLSLVAVFAVIYGIKKLASDGLDTTAVLCIVVGAVVGLLFVRRQIARPGSLVDIELFRRSAFSGSIAVNVLAMFAIVGMAVFLTQYLQLVLGMRPIEAALWSLVPSLATGGVAPATAAMARKVNRSFIMAGGFLTAAVGFGLLTQVAIGTHLWLVLIGASLYAGGLVAVISLVTGLVLGVAPPERAGSASALLESGTEFGGALGIAILGSIGIAVYRHRMDSGLPGSLPAGVLTPARESLAGATVAAAKLPGGGGQVLSAARSAFVEGFDIAAAVAGGIMIVAAFTAVAVLRRAGAVPLPTVPREQPEPVPAD
jgi:DHA2 family multidrug resistance protein-like MFS transporter